MMKIDNEIGLVVYGAPDGFRRREDIGEVLGKPTLCLAWHWGKDILKNCIAFTDKKPPRSDSYQIMSAAEAKALYHEIKGVDHDIYK